MKPVGDYISKVVVVIVPVLCFSVCVLLAICGFIEMRQGSVLERGALNMVGEPHLFKYTIEIHIQYKQG